jgi:hypothetical protein
METRMSSDSVIHAGSNEVHASDGTSVKSIDTRICEDDDVFSTVSDLHLISSMTRD